MWTRLLNQYFSWSFVLQMNGVQVQSCVLYQLAAVQGYLPPLWRDIVLFFSEEVDSFVVNQVSCSGSCFKIKTSWFNSFPSTDFIRYCVSNTVQYQLHFPSYPLVRSNGTTCQCRHTQERAFPIQVKLIHYAPKFSCGIYLCYNQNPQDFCTRLQ